jgi:hypothetical protein
MSKVSMHCNVVCWYNYDFTNNKGNDWPSPITGIETVIK